MKTSDKYDIEAGEHYWLVESRAVKDQNTYLISRCQVIDIEKASVRVHIPEQAPFNLSKSELSNLHFNKSTACNSLSKILSELAFDIELVKAEAIEATQSARAGDKKSALKVISTIAKLNKLERNMK